jgi:Tol biopolymer transport system component
MSQFNKFERKFANSLDSFPVLRGYLKTYYQFLNYLINSRSSSIDMHDLVKISNRFADEINFFGYYDKTPWSNLGDYLIFHKLNLETELLDIVVRDIQSNKNIVIGQSSLWNWQQGSMLQWFPGTDYIAYNKIVNTDKFGSVLVTTDGSILNTYEYPIQSISPCGNFFVSINYARLALLRPDYGYSIKSSNFLKSFDLENDGLWVVDIETGAGSLIVSLLDLINFAPQQDMHNSQHKVNHALVSPDGSKILFMHRWICSEGKYSRLYSISPDGTNLKLLLDDRMISHYSWKDSEYFLAWARTYKNGDHYYKISAKTGIIELIGENTLDQFGDGHPSYSPNSEWIVTDTYPGKDRKLSLHLYEVNQNKLYEIGRFFSPWKYRGEIRCDLHPRWSPDGKSIAIDSTHEGIRGLYILDVSQIVGER